MIDVRLYIGSSRVSIRDKILLDSLTIEKILCEGKNLHFGEVNTDLVKFTLVEDVDFSEVSRVEVSDVNSRGVRTVLGFYEVTYSTKKENSDYIDITMHNQAKKILDTDVADWYVSLPFPMTLMDLIDRLGEFDYMGDLYYYDYINADLMVYETVNPSKLLLKDLLRYIGEVNGVMFSCDHNYGNIVPVSLPDTNIKQLAKKDVVGITGITQKSYETKPIERITIKSAADDIGVSVGTGSNTYTLNGNILLLGLDQQTLELVGQRLLSQVEGLTWTPTTINTALLPTYIDFSGESFNHTYGFTFEDTHFYGFKQQFKTENGEPRLTITCDGNEEIKPDTSVETSLEMLRGKTNIMTRDIESNRLQIADVEQGLSSEITQLSDKVSIQIKEIQDELDGNISLYYVQATPTLLNYPAWDWTDMLCDGTWYPRDDLYFLYTPSSYQKHLRTLVYNESDGKSYRFQKENGIFYWNEVADTETQVILQKISNLEVTTEGIQADVSQVSLDLHNNYYNKTEIQTQLSQTSSSILATVSGTYATKSETSRLESKIALTSSEILAEVSAEYTTKSQTQSLSAQVSLKVNKSDLVSELNASADVIRLNAGRLLITSGNFQLDANGRITSKSGSIGGWTIAESSLSKSVGDRTVYLTPPSTTDANILEVRRGTTSLLQLRADGTIYTISQLTANGGIYVSGTSRFNSLPTVYGTSGQNGKTTYSNEDVLFTWTNNHLYLTVNGQFKGMIV